MDRQYNDQKKHGQTIQRPKETWTDNTTTKYEIFSDLNGKIDVLIASVSTGGHLSGVSKYLKQHCTF
jgi:cysteine synthase A